MPARVAGMGGAEATAGGVAIVDGAAVAVGVGAVGGMAGDAGMVVGVGGDGRAAGADIAAVAGATKPMREAALGHGLKPWAKRGWPQAGRGLGCR